MRTLILAGTVAAALAVAFGAEAGSQAFKPRKCGQISVRKGANDHTYGIKVFQAPLSCSTAQTDDDAVHLERDDPAPLVLPLRAFARRVGRDVRAHREERADHPRVSRRRLTVELRPASTLSARRADGALQRRLRGVRDPDAPQRRDGAAVDDRLVRHRPRCFAHRRPRRRAPRLREPRRPRRRGVGRRRRRRPGRAAAGHRRAAHACAPRRGALPRHHARSGSR